MSVITQKFLDRVYSVGVRVIFCHFCQKQRWAPRIPEALSGWEWRTTEAWVCPDCAEKHDEQSPS